MIKHSGISKLSFKGSGCITINKDGEILGQNLQVVKKGSRLKISSKDDPGMTHVTTSCGSVSFNSGSTIITQGGVICDQIGGYFCGSTMPGHTFSVRREDKGKKIVIINGKRVDLDKLDQAAPDDDESSEDLERHFIVGGKVNEVYVNGSANVTVDRSFLGDALTVSVRGSGGFEIPGGRTYERLCLNLNGSGDISGGTTKVLSANLTGSGDITNVHVTQTGTLELVGSGDIKVYKSRGARVRKSCTGSGDIKVRKV